MYEHRADAVFEFEVTFRQLSVGRRAFGEQQGLCSESVQDNTWPLEVCSSSWNSFGCF